QLRASRKRRSHGLGDHRGIRFGGQPVDRRIDVFERRIRLEEEVAGETEVRQTAVSDLDVDDDELSTGNFILTMHTTSLTPDPSTGSGIDHPLAEPVEASKRWPSAGGDARVEPGEHVGAHLALLQLVEHLVAGVRVDQGRDVGEAGTIAV